MDLNDLEQGLKAVSSAGFVLSCEELTSVQAGLTLLKVQEKLQSACFWGKILAQQRDYYIAFGLKDSEPEYPGKSFFYAGEDFVFKSLPFLTEEVGEAITMMRIMTPLTGVPSTPLMPMLEGTDSGAMMQVISKDPAMNDMMQQVMPMMPMMQPMMQNMMKMMGSMGMDKMMGGMGGAGNMDPSALMKMVSTMQQIMPMMQQMMQNMMNMMKMMAGMNMSSMQKMGSMGTMDPAVLMKDPTVMQIMQMMGQMMQQMSQPMMQMMGSVGGMVSMDKMMASMSSMDPAAMMKDPDMMQAVAQMLPMMMDMVQMMGSMGGAGSMDMNAMMKDPALMKMMQPMMQQMMPMMQQVMQAMMKMMMKAPAMAQSMQKMMQQMMPMMMQMSQMMDGMGNMMGGMTELDRLSLLVQEIDFDTAIAPKGAHSLTEAQTIVPNSQFMGLDPMKAMDLDQYVHFRAPASVASLKAYARNDLEYYSNFLDTLGADLPKRCWALRMNMTAGLVTLRSLAWPGYVAYHVPGTKKFGGVYFGFASKNTDLAFLI